MGFLFSCCLRSSADDDHEPLLAPQSPIYEDLPPPQSHIDKVADVFGALRVGKIPSQDQINAALRKALRSNVLAIEDTGKGARVLGQKHLYGPLSESGKIILKDVREIIEAVIQFGMEKNDDDRIQDLIYQNAQISNRPVSVNLDAAKDTEGGDEIKNLASVIPSVKELDNDARRLSDSLFTLSRILLTSSSFRLLLSDVLLTSRALLGDVAAHVGQAARNVERRADAVEQAVRPGDKEIESPEDRMDEAAKQVKDGVKDLGEGAKEKWDTLGTETSDRLISSAVDRLQKVLAEAQKEPAYRSALQTLMYLLSKYIEKVKTAVSAVSSMSTSTTTVPTSIIDADPHLKRALTDLRIVLERLASGRSLSPLIMHVEHTLRDVTNASSPEFQNDLDRFFEDLRSAIERGLGEPGFATSEEGRQMIQKLFERGQALMQSNELWSAEAKKVLDEVDEFIHALASDRTTRRVIDSLDRLSNDTADLFQTAAGVAVKRQRALREELKKDLFGWLLPRALTLLETLPMPRVETKSDTLEVVVDALVLSAATSFLPDHIFVQNWNELRLETLESPEANREGVQIATRTHVHIDGLRISAHRMGYYVQYTGLCGGLISWEDSGLINVDVGRFGASGEGLSVDIDLETLPEDATNDQNSVFRVNDVQADIRGLHVTIVKSRHWILNKLCVQPMAGPVIRRELRSVLASQIRAALENLNEKLSAVRSEVNKRAEAESATDGRPSIEDYFRAVCATIGSLPLDEESEDQESSLVETDTQVTLRGVVRKTRTQMHPESASPPTPTETLVAVGMGPQILPGKGGPEPGVDSATDQARGAAAEAERTVEHVAGKAKAVADDAVGAVVEARESLEHAEAREEAREGVEVKKKGWRSRVFDF
ncbi:hypothetical protein JB92DRAFT_2926409 [Gautieria morchelliformis]|nr:hypothetical protein JB92DRAFT_2926409 [Gautieria morchelliformis]